VLIRFGFTLGASMNWVLDADLHVFSRGIHRRLPSVPVSYWNTGGGYGCESTGWFREVTWLFTSWNQCFRGLWGVKIVFCGEFSCRFQWFGDFMVEVAFAAVESCCQSTLHARSSLHTKALPNEPFVMPLGSWPCSMLLCTSCMIRKQGISSVRCDSIRILIGFSSCRWVGLRTAS